MRKYLLPLSVAAIAAMSSSAFALQASDNFQARITIQTSCLVVAGDLDFGNVGVIVGGETATANVNVNCSAGTAYTLSFNPLTAGVTSYNSTMANGVNSVAYSAAVSAGGGTGPASFTINGILPVQATPVAGIYTSNQTLYVNY